MRECFPRKIVDTLWKRSDFDKPATQSTLKCNGGGERKYESLGSSINSSCEAFSRNLLHTLEKRNDFEERSA